MHNPPPPLQTPHPPPSSSGPMRACPAPRQGLPPLPRELCPQVSRVASLVPHLVSKNRELARGIAQVLGQPLAAQPREDEVGDLEGAQAFLEDQVRALLEAYMTLREAVAHDRALVPMQNQVMEVDVSVPVCSAGGLCLCSSRHKDACARASVRHHQLSGPHAHGHRPPGARSHFA